ncbi:MAG: DUF4198 domain-containing protein [Deltaproteobacteria bacterium]|nr:DUF4198 domain-containing protein [Deltaproteobacteria bacterium]
MSPATFTPYAPLAALAALAVFAAAPAARLLAHDMWADAVDPQPGKPLAVIVGYGHSYPTLEAIPAEEYPLFQVRLAGPEGDVPLAPGEPNCNWTSAGPVKEGAYLALTDVKPVFWTRTSDGWAMKPKNETPGAGACGHFIESAKGVVNVGNPGSDSVVTSPAGLPLEIVPGVNPASAKAGAAIPLTVLFKGEPLRGAEVSARYAGFDKLTGSSDSKAFYGVTDVSGKLSFVPLVPGEWLVTVRNEEPYQDKAACDKTDYGTSLHFTIK